jgi:predicted  nucleic acid-binding Zn-ribbon protein
MAMIKNAIAPIQAWLMSQGKCVGCGTPLKRGKREEYKKGFEKVTCNKCGRIFIYDKTKNSYRRALLEEV